MPENSIYTSRVIGDPTVSFFEKMERITESGCWLWTGAINNKGYGQIWIPSIARLEYAHRFSYRVHVGPICRSDVVMHSCDVPCCVNPFHLSLGDQVDNMADAAKKGRLNIKLSEKDVIKIRNRKNTGPTALSREFGVNVSTIQRILNGITWKYLLA